MELHVDQDRGEEWHAVHTHMGFLVWEESQKAKA